MVGCRRQPCQCAACLMSDARDSDPDASGRPPDASRKHPDASRKHPDASRRHPDASGKHPDASGRHTDVSGKDAAASRAAAVALRVAVCRKRRRARVARCLHAFTLASCSTAGSAGRGDVGFDARARPTKRPYAKGILDCLDRHSAKKRQPPQFAAALTGNDFLDSRG